MACGTCAECGKDTHIELFDGPHIEAAGHKSMETYLCLRCESDIHHRQRIGRIFHTNGTYTSIHLDGTRIMQGLRHR